MMAPIIAELKKEYTGRASILFIDVWNIGSRWIALASGPFRPKFSTTRRAGRSNVTWVF
jgi:hypothetical protein